MYYKFSDDVEWQRLDFLQKQYVGNIPTPPFKAQLNGFEKKKVENILKNLGDLIPENRRRFWLDLPEKIIVE